MIVILYNNLREELDFYSTRTKNVLDLEELVKEKENLLEDVLLVMILLFSHYPSPKKVKMKFQDWPILISQDIWVLKEPTKSENYSPLKKMKSVWSKNTSSEEHGLPLMERLDKKHQKSKDLLLMLELVENLN